MSGEKKYKTKWRRQRKITKRRKEQNRGNNKEIKDDVKTRKIGKENQRKKEDIH